MTDKPQRASDYRSEYVELVRGMCLHIATKLGDLMDELVVVGGLVPSLLIDQEKLAADTDAHVGTMDLDVGLTLALLDHGRYHTLTERLRAAGLTMDTKDNGNAIRQRWKVIKSGTVTVDFLIQPSLAGDKGGRLRNIEPDLAAIIAPGLGLAFQDHERVTIDGKTLFGEKARRQIWCCGAGAFVVLKALAFDGRGENKDAYDLAYVIRNYGRGMDDLVTKVRPLLGDPDAQKALAILRRDFLNPAGVGPRRVAEFLVGAPDDVIQDDVVSFVAQLLEKCGKAAPTGATSTG